MTPDHAAALRRACLLGETEAGERSVIVKPALGHLKVPDTWHADHTRAEVDALRASETPGLGGAA
jgi:hypothetical protein